MGHETGKIYLESFWLLIGIYYAIDSVSGSHFAAGMTLICTYIAGRGGSL